MSDESVKTVNVQVQANDGPKPGYKTTEFWGHAIVTLLGLLLASGAIHTGSQYEHLLGGAMAVLSQLGYSQARSIVKSGE